MEGSIAAFRSEVIRIIAQTKMTELSCKEADEAARDIRTKFEQAIKDHAGLELLESQYALKRLQRAI